MTIFTQTLNEKRLIATNYGDVEINQSRGRQNLVNLVEVPLPDTSSPPDIHFLNYLLSDSTILIVMTYFNQNLSVIHPSSKSIVSSFLRKINQ